MEYKEDDETTGFIAQVRLGQSKICAACAESITGAQHTRTCWKPIWLQCFWFVCLRPLQQSPAPSVSQAVAVHLGKMSDLLHGWRGCECTHALNFSIHATILLSIPGKDFVWSQQKVKCCAKTCQDVLLHPVAFCSIQIRPDCQSDCDPQSSVKICHIN